MATLKLTAYKGIDPEDGTGVYMITLGDPATPDEIDAFAFGVDDDGGDKAILDIPGCQMAFALGIWQLGKATPIAHQLLAQDTTEQLWQVDVEGSRRH